MQTEKLVLLLRLPEPGVAETLSVLLESQGVAVRVRAPRMLPGTVHELWVDPDTLERARAILKDEEFTEAEIESLDVGEPVDS